MAAAAIPLLMTAGTTAAGYLSSKGSTDQSGVEQNASQQQSILGGQLAGNAGQLGQIGARSLGQSSNYFSSLAGGNRATMTQALSPDIANANSIYGGTSRTLGRFLRGPTENVQMAESERQRGAAIGNLYATARPNANAALAGIGQGAFGMANQAAGAAGGIFGQQAGQAQASRFGGAALGMQAGQGFGGLLFNLLKAYGGKSGGSGGGGSLFQNLLPNGDSGPVQSWG